MFDCCYIGVRLMLQRLWIRRNNSTNPNEQVDREKHINIKSYSKSNRDQANKLPDEMLEIISKFRKWGQSDKVTISVNSRVIHFKYYNTNKFANTNSGTKSVNLRCPDTLVMLREFLKKSSNVTSLNISDVRIGGEWLKVMENLKHKNRIYVTLNACYFNTSLVDMKRVLGKFKSVKINIYATNTMSDKNIATDEVLCSLISFANVKFLYKEKEQFTFPEMTDKILKQLQNKLPNKFMVGNQITSFSIAEVIKTLKKRAESHTMSARDCPLQWKLGIVKANSREEMLQAADEIRFMRGIVKEHPTHVEIWVKCSTVRIELN